MLILIIGTPLFHSVCAKECPSPLVPDDECYLCKPVCKKSQGQPVWGKITESRSNIPIANVTITEENDEFDYDWSPSIYDLLSYRNGLFGVCTSSKELHFKRLGYETTTISDIEAMPLFVHMDKKGKSAVKYNAAFVQLV